VSEKDFKQWLETHAAETLFAWLRARGRRIDDVHWPDREREGRKGQPPGVKTVDLTFTEDGRSVGVDIIELHESERHGRQYAEMGRLVGLLEKELRPLVRALNPEHTVAASWGLNWLPDRKTLRVGLESVKASILAEVPSLSAGEERLLTGTPGFVARLELICWASDTPTFGFMTMHEEQTGWLGQAAESMAEFLLASSKPDQLAGYEDARVLAVDRALMPIPNELAVAFESRRLRIPANWTAIYFVMSGAPDSLSQVWTR
jgi:hypothetical protein